jgi:3',5'-nucleoside bisphosphate phosphatase
MLYVDLHIHSHYSDGISTPRELILMAAEKKLAAVAICDHDNIEATDEALSEGARAGIEVLTGVELSTVYGEFQDLHLLGYGFDHHNSKLKQTLKEFQDFRETRNFKIMDNINHLLAEKGHRPLDFEEIRSQAQGTMGRPHVARALIRQGYARDFSDAFHRYLHPCNEPKRFFPTPEAIALILSAGGVPVLAHPHLITRDIRILDDLCQKFIPEGLAGIEAWSSGSTRDETERFITLARRRGLIVTGGSDFHGFDPDVLALGTGRGNLRVPYQCVEEIKNFRKERINTSEH